MCLAKGLTWTSKWKLMSSPVPVPYGAGGGLVSAKGGYHYLALSPRNKMVMRSGEQELQYETKKTPCGFNRKNCLSLNCIVKLWATYFIFHTFLSTVYYSLVSQTITGSCSYLYIMRSLWIWASSPLSFKYKTVGKRLQTVSWNQGGKSRRNN